MTKERLNEINRWARAINSFRVIPRLGLIFYFGIVLWGCAWFMGLAEPNGSQATFITGLLGAGGVFSGIYLGTGSVEDEY